MNLSRADEILLLHYLRMADEPEVERERYCPHTPYPKQQRMLDTTEKEVLFGGEAGGGKSDVLLMGALQHMHVSGYKAIIFRRTYKQLEELIDRTNEWLSPTSAKPNDKRTTWRFTSGAILRLRHMQHEKDRELYQGQQYQFIGFDEVTHFTERMYKYMFSRCRRPESMHAPLRIWSTANPGGIGHEFIKRRFGLRDKDNPDEIETFNEKTGRARRFVRSRLSDNPALDADEYSESLMELDEITRKQLMGGEWVIDSGGQLYKYVESRNVLEMLPDLNSWNYVLSIDLGAAQNKPTTSFTVQAFNYSVPDMVIYVQSEKRAAMIPHTIAERIKELDERFSFHSQVADAGALGKGYVEEFRRRYNLPVQPANKSDKLGYRKLMNGDFERGVIRAYRGGCETLIKEWNETLWDDDGLDAADGQELHESDSALYGWRECKHWLAQSPKIIPATGTPERAAYDANLMKKKVITDGKRHLAQTTRRR